MSNSNQRSRKALPIVFVHTLSISPGWRWLLALTTGLNVAAAAAKFQVWG
jgi:hypothetical protein